MPQGCLDHIYQLGTSAFYATALFVTLLPLPSAATFLCVQTFLLFLVGTRMRNSLMTMIYRKCLRLSNSSLQVGRGLCLCLCQERANMHGCNCHP